MAEKERLGRRLAYWRNQLRFSKQYPWTGTGLLEDLEKAATLCGVNPNILFPNNHAPATFYTENKDPVEEYDL